MAIYSLMKEGSLVNYINSILQSPGSFIKAGHHSLPRALIKDALSIGPGLAASSPAWL